MGLGLCCSVNICFNSSQWVFVGRVYTSGSLSWILAWGVKHEWSSKSPEKTFFYTAENKKESDLSQQKLNHKLPPPHKKKKTAVKTFNAAKLCLLFYFCFLFLVKKKL